MFETSKQRWFFAILACAVSASIGFFVIALIINIKRTNERNYCANCGLVIGKLKDWKEHPHIDFCGHHNNLQEAFYYTCLPLLGKDLPTAKNHGPGKCITYSINKGLPDAPVMDKPRGSP